MFVFLEGNFWISNPELCNYTNPRRYSSTKKGEGQERLRDLFLQNSDTFFQAKTINKKVIKKEDMIFHD